MLESTPGQEFYFELPLRDRNKGEIAGNFDLARRFKASDTQRGTRYDHR